MHINSFAAAAGVVLLAMAGAAQADEALTARSSIDAEGFSALVVIDAVPLTMDELTAVHGPEVVASDPNRGRYHKDFSEDFSNDGRFNILGANDRNIIHPSTVINIISAP